MTNPGAGNLERAHLKRRGRDARDKHEQRAACAGLLWNEREVACIRGHLVRARMLITLAGPSTSPHVERTFGAHDGAILLVVGAAVGANHCGRRGRRRAQRHEPVAS